MDAMKLIEESEPLELLDLWMKIGLYLHIDTNADILKITSHSGVKITVRFETPDTFPEKNNNPKFIKTIADDLEAHNVKMIFKGGKPPKHEPTAGLATVNKRTSGVSEEPTQTSSEASDVRTPVMSNKSPGNGCRMKESE